MWYYSTMMPRKSDKWVNISQKIFISSRYAQELELPKKAIGIWVIAKEEHKYYRLRKVRLDGYLASDKGNNFQKISKEDFKQLEILNDNEKFYWVFYGLSKRKIDWLKNILEKFANDEDLEELIWEIGKYKIVRQILSDTNKNKRRLYTSLQGAISYWKKYRLENFKPNYE